MKRGELKPDIRKMYSIFRVLQTYPDGIWFRKIVVESKLPISTVHHYIEKYFAPFVDNVGYQTDRGYLGLRLIRLKKDVTLNDLVNYHKIKEKIRG